MKGEIILYNRFYEEKNKSISSLSHLSRGGFHQSELPARSQQRRLLIEARA